MYKVLKPLAGYGYEVGTVTTHIAQEHVEKFLKHNHIELVTTTAPEPEAPKKSKKSGK